MWTCATGTLLANPRNIFLTSTSVQARVTSVDDRGDAWKTISPEFAREPGRGNRGPAPLGVITSVSESRLRQGVIYVGLDNGQVHCTRDDGRTWTPCHNGLPPKWVSRVEASRHELGTAYVSLTGYREDDFSTYLYRSTDYGATWTSIASNLVA